MSEPPTRCVKHLDEPASHPCGACGDARAYNTEWRQAAALEDAQRASTEARERGRLRQLDIERCDLCDATGYANGALCSHDPHAADRARRGAEACRQALTEHKEGR